MALSRGQYLRQTGAVKQTPVDPLHLKFSEFRVPLHVCYSNRLILLTFGFCFISQVVKKTQK